MDIKQAQAFYKRKIGHTVTIRASATKKANVIKGKERAQGKIIKVFDKFVVLEMNKKYLECFYFNDILDEIRVTSNRSGK
jgi:ribosome maturation factor RimP